MSTDRQLDDTISRWLEAEAPTQLPDRVLRATFERTRRTRQQAVWQAVLRRTQMNRMIFALGGAAAVLVVAVLALGLYGNQPGGIGGQPSASPTQAPSPIATLLPESRRGLGAGTYAYHPLPPPNDSVSVTFTVPEGWEAFGTTLLPTGDPSYEPPGGMAIFFDDVTSLNGDPCAWSGTEDDVTVGPTVDDLVAALRAQTAYEVSDPVDVTIGGYSGTRVDIVFPTEPFAGQTSDAPDCDEGNYSVWSTAAYGEYPIYVQGPADTWRTNIVDVDGTRLVIVTRYFPGTSPADRAEMDAIIESLVLSP